MKIETEKILMPVASSTAGEGLSEKDANTVFSSREFLRLIEDSSSVGTWGWTFATREHVWSSGFWRLLGLNPGDLTPGYETFIAFIHPSDRINFPSEAQILEGSIEPEQNIRMIRPNGSTRILSLYHKTYTTPDGSIRKMATVILDSTDKTSLLKQQAAKIRRRKTLFKEKNIISYSVSLDGKYSFTHKLAELTGMPMERLNDDVWSSVVPAEREHWKAISAAARSSGQAYSLHPLVHLADGRQGKFSNWSVPVRNAAGEIEEWSGSMHPADTAVVVASDTMQFGLEQAVEGRHFRAARALLDWSMADLARHSGLSLSTVRRLEDDADGSADRSRHRAVAALKVGGVRFTFTEAGKISLTPT